MGSGYKASPAAYNLHAAVLKARPDIAAAVHTHSPANLAVSAQKGGLRPITQQAMRFYNRIAYYPNEVDDTTPEATAQLARALGDKWTMILENHGALVCGTSLAEAYIYHHFFELAAPAQVGALAGAAELITPAPDVCEERAKKFGRIGQYNHQSRDWVAGMALARKLFPDHMEQPSWQGKPTENSTSAARCSRSRARFGGSGTSPATAPDPPRGHMSCVR